MGINNLNIIPQIFISNALHYTYIRYSAPFCQRGRSSSFAAIPCTPGTQKQQNGASTTIKAKPAII